MKYAANCENCPSLDSENGICLLQDQLSSIHSGLEVVRCTCNTPRIAFLLKIQLLKKEFPKLESVTYNGDKYYL